MGASTFSNMNISETSRQITVIFYLKHHWAWGKAPVGFDSDWIRTLVSMATNSSHRDIMGKRCHHVFSNVFDWIISYGILMVRRPSGVRPSLTISNIFFSKTACPIKAKFYVEPPWVGGTKVCSRHLGHMTKMAATPIYGKNPSKIFFSRTGRPIFTKLGM